MATTSKPQDERFWQRRHNAFKRWRTRPKDEAPQRPASLDGEWPDWDPPLPLAVRADPVWIAELRRDRFATLARLARDLGYDDSDFD